MLDAMKERISRGTSVLDEFIVQWEKFTGRSAETDPMQNARAFYINWLRTGYVPPYMRGWQ